MLSSPEGYSQFYCVWLHLYICASKFTYKRYVLLLHIFDCHHSSSISSNQQTFCCTKLDGQPMTCWLQANFGCMRWMTTRSYIASICVYFKTVYCLYRCIHDSHRIFILFQRKQRFITRSFNFSYWREQR